MSSLTAGFALVLGPLNRPVAVAEAGALHLVVEDPAAGGEDELLGAIEIEWVVVEQVVDHLACLLRAGDS